MTTKWLLVPIAVLACASPRAQVSFERILNAEREPHNWLSYSATLDNKRHSLLTQINTQNVAQLELQWVWQARSLEKFEATPLVADGVLYTVQAPNDVVALDAATGRLFWTYHHEPMPEARPCCGRVNRGLAILDDTLFMGTIDAHLLAIDAKSGRLIWDAVVADARQLYSITMSPNVIKDKVIIGYPRSHLGVRRQDRQGGLALLHDSGAGRAGQRDVVGRLVEDGRGRRMECGGIRSRDGSRVLGHRQSRARLGR
jgi:glucose dehydrogenase